MSNKTDSSSSLISACVVNLIFALGGVFLNSLVIFVFLYSSRIRHSKSYFLIMVLSCIDLVVVAVIHPLSILYTINNLKGNYVCAYEELYEYFVRIICSLSAGALLAMSTERYLAIVHPFFHQRTVTNKRLLLLIGIFWIFPLLLWLLTFRFPVITRITSVAGPSLYFLLYLLTSAKILRVARKKRRQRFMIPALGSDRTEKFFRKYKEYLRDVKFATTYILAVLCSIICYCPSVVVNHSKYIEPCSEKRASLNNFLVWTRTLIAMNSTFNCLIFFWRNKTLRNESKKVLKCFRVQNNGRLARAAERSC